MSEADGRVCIYAVVLTDTWDHLQNGSNVYHYILHVYYFIQSWYIIIRLLNNLFGSHTKLSSHDFSHNGNSDPIEAE